MRRGSSVGVILLLVLGFHAVPALAQEPPGSRDRGFRLEQNYPNPFNPETRIPFALDEGLFQRGTPVVVSIRIYNVLHQLVAVPTALNHPDRPGAQVLGLQYSTPGGYEAYWNGHDLRGREVASATYFVHFQVHGYPPQVMRITVAK
jgi:hypothetical protein